MTKMIQNPVLKGFNPDPSICRVGDDYYIATSTFDWFPGVQIHHSTDMVNWHLVSNPLNRVSQLDMIGNPDSGGVWAPQLSYHDGLFWLIYSNIRVVDGGTWKDGSNYLVTSETIDGDWSEPIYLNNSGFDPSLFHDEDGRQWLVNMMWDHRTYNHKFYGIVLQEYNNEEKRLAGEWKVIFKGTNLGLTEAPHLYKANGYYYLLVAEGGTKFDHASTIARSKNIDGPYEVHPDKHLITSWPHPELELQKAGHGSFVVTQDGEWYFAHLAARPIKLKGTVLLDNRGYCPLGRETAIQKVYWENDWPYIVGGNKPSMEVEAPDLPEQTWERDYDLVDHFDSEKLNHHFNTLRIPFNEEIGSLTALPGHLRLYGRESLHSSFVQSLVARRWQSLNFTAETKVAFEPDSFQQQAGLICHYNTRNWTSIHVTWSEEKGRVIDIMTCDRFVSSNPLEGKEVAIPDGVKDVYFRVDTTPEKYYFSYSFDGEVWEKIDIGFDTYKLSDDYIEQAGFFTGAFVGMHCMDVSGRRFAADFDYFAYEEKE